MGRVKDMMMAYKEQELYGELSDDGYLAWVNEMEQIQQDHILPDYVVLTNNKRCYIGNDCLPYHNICECK